MQRVLDQDDRPVAVSDTRSDGLSTGFAFDTAGNLSALTAAGNTAPVVSLDYDALGRLTAFKDGPTGTVIDGYSYDATGNRLSAKVNTTTQTYTYLATNHRLSAVAGKARTYDALGNTLSIGGTAKEFVYDTNGRMGQAKRAGAVVMNNQYNGRGEQVRKFLGTAGTYTLYDETGHWLGDYDSTGLALQQVIWLDDLPVGVLASYSLHYVQPDHLGTPRAVIDPVRDVAIWTWDLKGEAFGNSPPNQDPDNDGNTFPFDMRFPGQRYDAATGLNQNYFRDYEPGMGRYGQSDRIGLAGGKSTYSYVSSNPMNFVDLLGLTQEDIDYLFALAKEMEADLKFLNKLKVKDLGDGKVGHTNYAARAITIDDRYLDTLSPAQRTDLYDTIVHEGLHLTKGMFYSARNHPKIHEEAARRTEAAKKNIEGKGNDCTK
jgi:RHS repeat-associated protein